MSEHGWVAADSKNLDTLLPHRNFVTFASVPKVAMLANKVIFTATQCALKRL